MVKDDTTVYTQFYKSYKSYKEIFFFIYLSFCRRQQFILKITKQLFSIEISIGTLKTYYRRYKNATNCNLYLSGKLHFSLILYKFTCIFYMSSLRRCGAKMEGRGDCREYSFPSYGLINK